MPSNEISTPASPAPMDRLLLTTRWVRPGATGLGETTVTPQVSGACAQKWSCFEGGE
jgi:hypothetical protein